MKQEQLIEFIKEVKRLYEEEKYEDMEFILNTVLKELEKEI